MNAKRLPASWTRSNRSARAYRSFSRLSRARPEQCQNLTLRENSERPITVKMGTNTGGGTDTAKIVGAALNARARPVDQNRDAKPPLWDGRTADRILDALATYDLDICVTV